MSEQQNDNQADDVGIASSLAARMLSDELGSSELIWLQRLANWRKPGRKHPIPWIEREAGHPQYRFADITAFIEQELAKRPPTVAAVTIEDRAKSAAVVDVEQGVAFVRVLWNARTASGTFSLTVDAAEALTNSLKVATVKARTALEEQGQA